MFENIKIQIKAAISPPQPFNKLLHTTMRPTNPDKVHHYNNYKNISQQYKTTNAPAAKTNPAAAKHALGKKAHRKSVSTQSSAPLSSPNDSLITVNESYPAFHMHAYAQQGQLSPQHFTARGYDRGEKYKTEICKNIQLRGVCKWGGQCFFAHSKEELQSKMPYNHYYKTKVCKHYNTTGFCPYANRCQYFHIKSHQVFSELLDCFEKKVGIKLMEQGARLDGILADTERVQKRLPIFKSFAGGSDGLSFQEKCLVNIF